MTDEKTKKCLNRLTGHVYCHRKKGHPGMHSDKRECMSWEWQLTRIMLRKAKS